MKYILVLLLCISTHVKADDFRHFDEWNTDEQMWFASYNFFNYIDYRQTSVALGMRSASGEYLFHEKNPVFGTRPSRDKLIVGKLIAGGTWYYIIGKYGFKDKRIKHSFMFLTGLQAGVVLHNNSVGISFNYIY